MHFATFDKQFLSDSYLLFFSILDEKRVILQLKSWSLLLWKRNYIKLDYLFLYTLYIWSENSIETKIEINISETLPLDKLSIYFRLSISRNR
jgi:nucleoid-associated protein YejK